MEEEKMKNQGWGILGIGALIVAAGLAASHLSVLAHPTPRPGRAAQTVQRETSAAPMKVPLALKGTALIEHPEVVQGVDGNPANMIDYRQYDQIQEYFLKQIAKTPAKRGKLWKVNFSS